MLTISYDLTNCDITTKYDKTSYNIILTCVANEGYQFIENNTSEDYLQYGNGDKIFARSYEIENGIIKKATITTKQLEYDTSALIHFKAYKLADIPVTQNLSNCTSNFNGASIQANSSTTITLTAAENCYFKSTPTFTINSTTYDFISNGGNTVFTATITAPLSGAIIINASANVIGYTIEYNLVNCTSSFTDTFVVENTSIVITIKGDMSSANTPYIFTQIPTITNGEFTRVNDSEYQCTITIGGTTIINAIAGGNGGYSVNYQLENAKVIPALSNISYKENITFTVTANSGYKFDAKNPPYYTLGDLADKYYLVKISDYEYALHSANINYAANLTIGANTVADSVVPPLVNKSYGFIEIYLPSLDNLKALTNWRFYKHDDKYDDMWNYVYKLHKLYINIPVKYETTVSFAYHRTNVKCNATYSDIITYNCGAIQIPELYENIFDYQYTKTQVYLPFIGYRDLDTCNVMNSTVNLKYSVNIISGKTLAILSTIERGNLYQFEGIAGYDIPFMLNLYSNGINHDFALNSVNSAYLGDFTPSIGVTTNIPYGDDYNPFGYAVSKWIKISDCHGYIKCQDVQLVPIHNFITHSEFSMIVETLKNGIFI